MSANHGTHSRYAQGCRCDDCREGHRLKAREYSQRKSAGLNRARVHDLPTAPAVENSTPGPVESGVQAEIGAVVAERPGLAAIALAMARLLDDPAARNQAPAASKVLVSVLDALGKVAAPRRRSHLALVREMTTKVAPDG
jgi:hypothetical protein